MISYFGPMNLLETSIKRDKGSIQRFGRQGSKKRSSQSGKGSCVDNYERLHRDSITPKR